MVKWIRNSRGSNNNKSTGIKGISMTPQSNYKSIVTVKTNENYSKKKQVNLQAGTFDTMKEGMGGNFLSKKFGIQV